MYVLENMSVSNSFYIVLEETLKTEFSTIRKKLSDIIKEYEN